MFKGVDWGNNRGVNVETSWPNGVPVVFQTIGTERTFRAEADKGKLLRAARDVTGSKALKDTTMTVPAIKPTANAAKSKPEGPSVLRNIYRNIVIDRLLADPDLLCLKTHGFG